MLDGVQPWSLAITGPRVGPDIPPDVWNTVFGWLPIADQVAAPTPAPAVAVVGYSLVAAIVVVGVRRGVTSATASGDTDDEVRELDMSAMLEEKRRQGGHENAGVGAETGPGDVAAGEGRTLADLSERHKNLVAPPEIDTDTRAPRVGEQYTKTLVVGEFPDFPVDGFLSELYSLTDAQFDVTAYIHQKHQGRTEQKLAQQARDLDGELTAGTNSSNDRLLAKHAEYLNRTVEAVQGGQAVFDLTMYVTIRGDTREELQANERKVRKVLRDEPANLSLDVIPGKQLASLQSASPLGPDAMRNEDPDRWGRPAVAGAVGALLASPQNPTLIEQGGFEFGLHKETKTPIIADPFARDNGHAVAVFGDPGAGKSVATKSDFIEFVTQREDVIGFIIEPLGNWEGIIEAANLGTDEEYQAEHIPIGGDVGINPLEIRPPADISQARSSRGSTLKEKESEVLSFVKNYFAIRGLQNQFAEHRTEFEEALRATWEDAGITDDPGTHDREDPTFRDLLDQLEARVENPEKYVSRHESEAENIHESAKWLLRQLGPFDEQGRYENLGRASEVDLHGSDIVYLDLGQEEGDVSEKATLTMQLLISLVYQRAKQTDKKVVLAMDEFRYLLRDLANLEFMETLFRHHRHHEISPWIMTQTVDEFFATESAKAILDMCTIKQFHKLEGMDEEWREEFRFNESVMRAIQEAQPGSEQRGYSDAVVGIDDEWHPVEVRLPDGEFSVIEYDPDSQSVTALPGVSDVDSHATGRMQFVDDEQLEEESGKPSTGGPLADGDTAGDDDGDGDGDGEEPAVADGGGDGPGKDER